MASKRAFKTLTDNFFLCLDTTNRRTSTIISDLSSEADQELHIARSLLKKSNGQYSDKVISHYVACIKLYSQCTSILSSCKEDLPVLCQNDASQVYCSRCIALLELANFDSSYINNIVAPNGCVRMALMDGYRSIDLNKGYILGYYYTALALRSLCQLETAKKVLINALEVSVDSPKIIDLLHYVENQIQEDLGQGSYLLKPICVIKKADIKFCSSSAEERKTIDFITESFKVLLPNLSSKIDNNIYWAKSTDEARAVLSRAMKYLERQIQLSIPALEFGAPIVKYDLQSKEFVHWITNKLSIKVNRSLESYTMNYMLFPNGFKLALLNDLLHIIKCCCYLIGKCSILQLRPREAKYYVDIALQLAKSLYDPESCCFRELGDVEKSINLHEICRKYFLETWDKLTGIRTYGYLARTYLKMYTENIDKFGKFRSNLSLQYCKKELQRKLLLSSDAKSIKFESESLLELGNFFQRTGDLANALLYYRKSITNYNMQGNTIGKLMTEVNISTCELLGRSVEEIRCMNSTKIASLINPIQKLLLRTSNADCSKYKVLALSTLIEIQNRFSCFISKCDSLKHVNELYNTLNSIKPLPEINKRKILECSICLNIISKRQVSNGLSILPCLHAFHSECINKWRMTKVYELYSLDNYCLQCPLCKRPDNVPIQWAMAKRHFQ